MLLSDQQASMQAGKILTYSETLMRIENSQGLAAGNISLSWDPATEAVTIHKLQIRRGDKVIDVLASGQTFTTLRRETSLDAAMLDGTLTANIQPEGLQVGDIIDMAATTEHSDPVLKGHVEGVYGAWNGVPFASARARLSWPAATKMNTRQSAGLPVGRAVRSGSDMVLELADKNIQPLIAPKGAPTRFSIGRLGEATDYQTWSQVADLFAPLYRDAAVIAPAGSLRDELNTIRNTTADPKARAELALKLVQERTRYVALLMGQGSFVPAPAEETWKRRFGDCKGKTALLLALLRELGIAAEPVLVNTGAGDAIAERLPMVQLFDHVLVRAHIGGKDYWLDGTRTGDTALDKIDVPDFGWGLPLVPDAKLVSIVPPPLDQPQTETIARIDASKGVFAPASVTVDQIFRGDTALVMNNGVKSLSEGQRQEFFNQYWKRNYDFITPGPTTATFDAATKTYRLSMKGEGKLDWNDRYFHVPNSSVGYSPNFDRTAGPSHDAPLAVSYPYYLQNLTTVLFPTGFFGSRRLGTTPTTGERLAGIDYKVSATNVSSPTADTVTVESSERALVPEIPYKEGLAAVSRLKELDDQDVALPLPQSYRATDADLAAMRKDTPETASAFLIRGNALMNAGSIADAIADFTGAIELDPKNSYALANRGLAYLWKGEQGAAEKDLAAAAVLDPENAVLLRSRGLIAEQKGDCKGAVEFYTASFRTEAGNGFALGHRALCERILGDTSAALADSEAALKMSPSWAELRVLRANLFFIAGKKDLVANEAELLSSQTPPNSYALVAAGKIYSKINDSTKAMKAFDQALAVKPEAYIYLNRAQSRPKSDRAGRMGDLEAALKLHPDDVDTMAAVADEYSNNGDFKRSLEIYDKLAVPSPGFSEYAVSRALLLEKVGRGGEAQKILTQESQKAKSAGDLNKLCWRKATAGIMLEAALEDCRRALKLKPDDAPTMDSLAFVLLRVGKIDDAIAEYTHAIAKSPLSASYMGRSLAYARKGDLSHSDADRAEALKLDSDAETRFADFGLKR
jgi:tetratricopeptide (TPR) repeat protein